MKTRTHKDGVRGAIRPVPVHTCVRCGKRLLCAEISLNATGLLPGLLKGR